MSESVRILIVEDAPSDFDLAQREIRKAVHECVFQLVETQQDFLEALEAFQPDLILSDYNMPNFDGLTALKLAQEHAKLTPFIIWTGTMGEDVAVELMRAGAVNYILKDNIKRLGPAVSHALEERRLLLEHKRAEEIIHNNEKRFRTLIENSRDNISLLAVDGTLLWESPATIRSLGYAQDEFVGHNIFELIHPNDVQWTSELYAKLIQEPGSRQDGIFRLRHNDGSWRWNEATVTNMLNEPGVNAIVVNYRDITERKQAEEKLKEERNLLWTLIDNLPDRIFVMDTQGRKTLSNTADWMASGGETMEQVLGKTDFDTYPSELAEEFWALDKVVLDSGESVINYEEPGLDSEGNPVWILSTKVPLRDSEGKIAGLVGIGRDITNRKRAEMERQALLEIMQGLANTDDLQEFLKLIHHSIASVIYAENFFVVFYNTDTGLFEETYSVDQYDQPSPPSALEKSVTSYVFRSGEPLLLTQTLFDELVEQGEVELVGTDSESWMGVPLKTQNRTIGVIAVQDYENPNRYTERDKDFLALIGSQVALAIERKRAEDQLNYHARLLRHINDAVIATDDQLRITAWNRAAEKMYGWRSEEVIGHIISEILSFDLTDIQRQEARALMKESMASRSERIHQRRDGRTLYVESNTIALLNEHGRMTGYVSVNRDITERKRSEKALHHSEKQYRSLFEDSPISLWVEDFSAVKQRLDELKGKGTLDLPAYFREHPHFVTELAGDIRIIDVNNAAMKLYHARQKSELLGSLAEVFHILPPEQFEAELIQIANGRLNFEREQIDQTLTGEKIHVNMRWSVAPGYEDSLAQVIVSTVDVTERKRAEEVMRQSQANLETAEAQAHLGSWSFDPYTQSEDWSKEMFRLFGRDPTLGAPSPAEFMELIHPEDRGRLTTAQTRILEGGESHSDDYRTNPAQIPLRVLNASFRSEKDGDGKVLRVVGTALDITERKRAQEQIQLQLQRVRALRAIDIAISSSFDLGLTLNLLLDQAIAQLKTDAAAILMFHPSTRTLEHAASRGFRSMGIREARLRLGEGYAGKAILERRMIHIPNLTDTDSGFSRALLLKDEDFHDYYCVPLIVKGEVKGVLEIFHRSALVDDPEWIDFLETLAGQAAIAIDNASLFEDLQHSNSELFQAYDATIEGWSHALDLRDKETEGHTLRVTEMTLELARKFDFTDEQMRYIRWGALLHDIGKMGVADSILLKPDKLTDEEWEIMKQHPVFAFEMLSPIAYLKSSLDIPYCHHEKWDGTGYPRGLKGEVIPLAARLFAIVDVWDALRSDRPYRKAWPREKTLEHIKSLSSTHFDPKVVEYFLDMMEKPNE